MATIHFASAGDRGENRTVTILRRFDPGGAYLLFSVYVSAMVGLAGLTGYATAVVLTGSKASFVGAVYSGLLTCLAVLSLKPTASPRPYREIAAAGAAILIGAGLGGLTDHNPVIAYPLTVLIAFAGFYVRRWPEPLPMAGLLTVLSFIISQILIPLTPGAVIHASILPLLVFISAGFWFLPGRMFTNAFVACVRRMRAALPGELRLRPENSADLKISIARVDAALRQINDARTQADQYNPACADRHLALVQKTATIARVWENTADCLHRVSGDVAADDTGQTDDALAVCRAAETAVADTLEAPSVDSREVAKHALSQIDEAVGRFATDRTDDGKTPDAADSALFHLLSSELALSHLLDAVADLDAELAIWAGEAK